MAVPNDDVKIHKFCKSFTKQFKDEGVCIEHYTQLDCLRSTWKFEKKSQMTDHWLFFNVLFQEALIT